MAQGMAHGGWCPRGRRSENGPIPVRYRLIETPSRCYSQRTGWNVRDSDATLIVTRPKQLSGGSNLTAAFARAYGRPFLHVNASTSITDVVTFLQGIAILRALNVAGSRASKDADIGGRVIEVLTAVLVPRAE
jgi:hypothetical protein